MREQRRKLVVPFSCRSNQRAAVAKPESCRSKTESCRSNQRAALAKQRAHVVNYTVQKKIKNKNLFLPRAALGFGAV
jgi:hypothetical protein